MSLHNINRLHRSKRWTIDNIGFMAYCSTMIMLPWSMVKVLEWPVHYILTLLCMGELTRLGNYFDKKSINKASTARKTGLGKNRLTTTTTGWLWIIRKPLHHGDFCHVVPVVSVIRCLKIACKLSFLQTNPETKTLQISVLQTLIVCKRYDLPIRIIHRKASFWENLSKNLDWQKNDIFL